MVDAKIYSLPLDVILRLYLTSVSPSSLNASHERKNPPLTVMMLLDLIKL